MGGKHRYRMVSPCPGIQVYDYRGDRDGMLCTAFVTDRDLSCARRPWAVVRLTKERKGEQVQWKPLVVANFRTLHQATALYDEHARVSLGLSPQEKVA